MHMENTRNAFQLAYLADCGTPDNPESPGAKMLIGIADGVYDNIDELRESQYPEELLTELVDGWPSIYTHEMWSQFVDLTAWQEDPEYGDTMYDKANACLYQIGERLAHALWEEIAKGLAALCQDCGGELTDDQIVVCAECGAERDRQEDEGREADARDNEAQVAGDPA